ncbi:MAG: M48 family metalloprotease [Lachnospiraceae bacterium]|nr:M48 family metalloprotease [Lachnospiraceae bacterium]
MYLAHFAKRLFRKGNITLIIYFFLNFFVISGLFHLLFQIIFAGEDKVPYWMSLIIGCVLYLFSVLIALSPVGEFMLRLQLGCHKIKRLDHQQYLAPIFKEVYTRAKSVDPSIPDDVELFINDSKYPNAFATGQKTICITSGMLKVPVKEFKAVLAHEFGHISHKDTDIILVISVGNMIMNAVFLAIQAAYLFIFGFLKVISMLAGTKGTKDDMLAEGMRWAYTLAMAFLDFLMWLWSKIGQLLVLNSSRAAEYEADEFSQILGYEEGLIKFLDENEDVKSKGLFAILSRSHPRNDDRIAMLQSRSENALISAYLPKEDAVVTEQPEVQTTAAMTSFSGSPMMAAAVSPVRDGKVESDHSFYAETEREEKSVGDGTEIVADHRQSPVMNDVSHAKDKQAVYLGIIAVMGVLLLVAVGALAYIAIRNSTPVNESDQVVAQVNTNNQSATVTEIIEESAVVSEENTGAVEASVIETEAAEVIPEVVVSEETIVEEIINGQDPGNPNAADVLEILHIDPNTIEDFSVTTDLNNYEYYATEIPDLCFYYPACLFNNAVIKEGIPYSIGVAQKEVIMTGTEGSSIEYICIHNDQTDLNSAFDSAYNEFTSYVIGVGDIYHKLGETSGTVVFTGFTDETMTMLEYTLMRVTSDKTMVMRAHFPNYTDELDKSYKYYYAECLYRGCGFTNSSKSMRTYEEYMKEY